MPQERISEFEGGATTQGGQVAIVQNGVTKKISVGTSAYRNTGSAPGEVPLLDSSGNVPTTDGGTGTSLSATGNSNTNQYFGTNSTGGAGMHPLPNGIEAYSSTATYRSGDVVLSNASLYLSQQNNNRGRAVTDTTYWSAIGSTVPISKIDTSNTPSSSGSQLLITSNASTASWGLVDTDNIESGAIETDKINGGAVTPIKISADARATEADVLTGTSNDKFITCSSLNDKIEEFERMNDEAFGAWSTITESYITAFTGTMPASLTDVVGTITIQNSSNFNVLSGTIPSGGFVYASPSCSFIPNVGSGRTFRGALIFDSDSVRWAFVNVWPSPDDYLLVFRRENNSWVRRDRDADQLRPSFASLPAGGTWYPISYLAHDEPNTSEVFEDEVCLGRRVGGVITALRLNYDSAADPDRHEFFTATRHLEMSLDRLEVPSGATAGQSIVVNSSADGYDVSTATGFSVGGTQASGKVVQATSATAQQWANLGFDDLGVTGTQAANKIVKATSGTQAEWADDDGFSVGGTQAAGKFVKATGSTEQSWDNLSLSDITISGTQATGKIIKATSGTAAEWADDATGASSFTVGGTQATGKVVKATSATAQEWADDESLSVGGTQASGKIIQATSASAQEWTTLDFGDLGVSGTQATGKIIKATSGTAAEWADDAGGTPTLTHSKETITPTIAYANRVQSSSDGTQTIATGKSFADWTYVQFKLQGLFSGTTYNYYSSLFDITNGAIGANNELLDMNGVNIDLKSNTTWAITSGEISTVGIVAIIGSKYTIS